MFKYLVIRCSHCHSEMDFVSYKSDDTSFGVGLQCTTCGFIIPVNCILPRDDHANDFYILEWDHDLPF